MPARKRPLHEVHGDDVDSPRDSSVLQRLRGMWQFANFCQWVLLFGPAVKLHDLDIADLEMECLKPHSMALQEIGLALLKFLSSHRGLTQELFDEYTRRQYLAKAPEKNPFGTDETPLRFADFDVFTKVRILQQMTQFVMMYPERLRERTEEQKDSEQTNWRIEPYGWDRDDRTYFVLDDNRLYRLTDAPLLQPKPKPKKNTKKAKAALRASKRRRAPSAAADDVGNTAENQVEHEDDGPAEDDGLGGMKWECVAVTLDEVRQFLATIQKTKDDNEKVLRRQIEDHLVPILEKTEESRKKKELQRQRELLTLEKMAYAKRSSRIAHKMEQQKLEEQIREDERKRREDELAARKEEQKRSKMERERDARLLSRSQRLKERETRRSQHQEEIAQLSDGSQLGRMSERRLKAEVEIRRQALRELDEEGDEWMFDCICGIRGRVDDGTHSVACEQCSVWQHSKCLGIDEREADGEDFHFVCDSCRRREQAERGDYQPRKIKIKLSRHGMPPSSPGQSRSSPPPQARPTSHLVAELPWTASRGVAGKASKPAGGGEVDQEDMRPTTGATDLPVPLPNRSAPGSPTEEHATSVSSARPPVMLKGANPFSSPHPNLSPPNQSPNKSRVYHAIYEPPSSPVQAGQARSVLGPPQGSQQPASGHPATALAAPVSEASTTSPSKRGAPNVTLQAGASSSSPPEASGAASFGQAQAQAQATPAPPPAQMTPSRREVSYDSKTPLLPSGGGLSPIKHSPPLSQHQLRQVNGVGSLSPVGSSPLAGSSSKPSLLPPAPALTPSPPQQILTPRSSLPSRRGPSITSVSPGDPPHLVPPRL